MIYLKTRSPGAIVDACLRQRQKKPGLLKKSYSSVLFFSLTVGLSVASASELLASTKNANNPFTELSENETRFRLAKTSDLQRRTPAETDLPRRVQKNEQTIKTIYRRLTPAHYADGIGAAIDGPNPRYVSNRIFNDSGQNLFAETGVTQWAYTWGQFIDHTVALRAEGDETIEVFFDSEDPLEEFDNSANNLVVKRSAASPGTGVNTVREQTNTVSSVIDAWAVYGGDKQRLEWLREGPLDNGTKNNGAKLLMTVDNYLPVLSIRGDAANAPFMQKMGQLFAVSNAEDQMVVAGDERANENIALTTVQTLFAREHNRIVDLLPDGMSNEQKFNVARKLVIALQQYITYEEFLPALGIYLSDPDGFSAAVDPTISQEFATVGYRAHSMVHGEIELEVEAGQYDAQTLSELEAQGIDIELSESDMEIAVPLNIAHGNPQLVVKLGLGALSKGLGGEPQYKNDEQIDNQLRSVLFQLPNPDIINPDNCLDGPTLNECYRLVNDIGLLDIVRGRDHGIAGYNVLREAYGLPRAVLFTDITQEDSEEFPVNDPEIDATDPINDPNILDFVVLFDGAGNILELGSEAADGEAVSGLRRTTLAARLKSVYQDVNQVDAFVGMVAEPHLPGTEFGPLQLAIWKRQFEDLRDGDPNFYLWNRELTKIMRQLKHSGLDYRQSLADVILNNTELESGDIQRNMFIAAED